MCGIVGFWSKTKHFDDVILKMSSQLQSRGPNDSGQWTDDDSGLTFAHTRLSVQDMSKAGAQPMKSHHHRFIITYNGEIYNHMHLRDVLIEEGYSMHWRGHSDTETLAAGFEAWGVKETLKKAVGMFSIAVWDQQKQSLILARDRIGEKPLYFGWQSNNNVMSFLFASQIKAFKPHPSFQNTINRNAMSLLLRHNYIPTPYSIYDGVHKLTAGHILELSISDLKQHKLPKSEAYWSLESVVGTNTIEPWQGGVKEAVDQLEALLVDSIHGQMISDVPIGAFLSGGIDSSTVVALMQSQSANPIKTFSIGFEEEKYNEAKYAKAVAKHLGTQHTELYVSSKLAMSEIPKLSSLYDEPFSDSSQLSTLLVCQLAKKNVTVSLSGDGGDELFCGYNRYKSSNFLWKKLNHLPLPIRQNLASILVSISPTQWDKLSSLIPKNYRYSNFGDKIHKGADVLSLQSIDEHYYRLVSHWQAPTSVVIDSSEPPTLLSGNSPELQGLDEVERMMALDTLTFLPDDILVKLDRASMGVSLETRVPFLDHRVVEFAWRLPQSLKLKGTQTKWILRQVLHKHVPKSLIERPKMGFGVPIDEWLKGPLREWSEHLLNENRLKQEGFFHSAPIRQKWSDHLSGKRNWQYHLWDILMFQSWLEKEREH